MFESLTAIAPVAAICVQYIGINENSQIKLNLLPYQTLSLPRPEIVKSLGSKGSI